MPRSMPRIARSSRGASRPRRSAPSISTPSATSSSATRKRSRGDDARDGEGAAGDARRRAGSDRHGVPDGRRRPPPARRDDALRAPQQVQHGRAHAPRRRRSDHAVELSDRHPGMEVDGGADLRQHGRHQAGIADAAVGGHAGRGVRGSGTAEGRVQRGDGRRQRSRRADAERIRRWR